MAEDKHKTKYYIATDEEIIEALNRNNGIIYYTADELNYSRTGLENRIRNSPILKEALQQARQTIIDKAENSLFSKIENGEWQAIEFSLKRLGKDRGYGDVSEINVNANIQGEVKIDLSVLTMEELEKLNELTAKITSTDGESSI